MAGDAPKRIGDLLLERGYVSNDQIKSALSIQQKTGKKLGHILVDAGIINEEQLVDVISERLKIHKLNLSSLVINPNVIATIPVEVAKKYKVLPVLKMGNTLTVAMVDPLNAIALEEIKYLTKCVVKRAVVGEKALKEAIDQYYSVADSVRGLISHDKEEAAGRGVHAESRAGDILSADSTVVRLVNLILSRAVQDGASDIHLEPDETQLRIRYRINAVMREEAAPPKKLQAEIISRIKIAADLDVSEKRLPQDGRMAILVDNRSVDLRVSTLPTIHGEKIVVRILDKRHLKTGLPELGMVSPVVDRWRRHIRRPEGLILISGPTSSGKTSTLYASLQEINSVEKNIITVEDPVEYSLPIINQVQINEKTGLSFASALRSMLRQNPDIIMIGEIRDTETAAIAVRASLTGHLVLSTIHTNDSISAVTRLIDMGIELYMVASALEAVLAQRLVRTICPECREPADPPKALLERVLASPLDTPATFYHGAGCMKCRGTGYAGMTALFELFEINDHIREMILVRRPEGILRSEAARNGYRPLFETGLELALAGTTSLDEVLRVTSPVLPQTTTPITLPVDELP